MTQNQNEKLIRIWLVDGKSILRYYLQKIKKYNNEYASLDWRNKKSFYKVSKVVNDLIDTKKVSSILDIGCGTGNFYDFFIKKYHPSVDYEGIDLVKTFVRLGQKRHPRLKFAQANFISDSYWPRKKYDLVINLGGLNSRVRFYKKYLKHSIAKMVALANKYVVFNLVIAANKKYFPKGNNEKVGHITSLKVGELKAILKNLKKHNHLNYEIKKEKIFDHSIDVFVKIEKQ